MTRRSSALQTAIVALSVLIAICIAWESVLAPLRPGGSWLILKALPLAWMLAGLLRSRVYSAQWGSMAILLYLGEGCVRVVSDVYPRSIGLAALEIVCSVVVFAALLVYVKTFKRVSTDGAQI